MFGGCYMFVERLNDDDLADYVQNVTLKNVEYDRFEICSVENWNNRLCECECRQINFVIEYNGVLIDCGTDIEDFSFTKEHCVYMLKHFGDEYLNYLRYRINEEDISETAKTCFIKQNVARLAVIKSKEASLKQTYLSISQKTLDDFEKQ